MSAVSIYTIVYVLIEKEIVKLNVNIRITFVVSISYTIILVLWYMVRINEIETELIQINKTNEMHKKYRENQNVCSFIFRFPIVLERELQQ